ncbi:unnamed protein product [Effrenium voratum]|nr:unnamed protein product [Effrenium voratum]
MDLPSSCTPDRVSPHPQATSLVLKRLPPRCTTAILLQVLDDIADDQYDYVHLPLDHQTNKNMSLAFLNFTNHEAADRAFNLLRRPSDFPDAFAPSTKAIWGAIHGLGPNLAHFIARYGFRALDPPYAPLIFENGKCVPRTQDVLRNLGLCCVRCIACAALRCVALCCCMLFGNSL